MKLKLLTLSTLTLATLSYANLVQPAPNPFTPIVEIKNNLTTILPEVGVMLEDGGEKNLANYLLPKIKKGKLHLDNNVNIGFCGEKTYIIAIGIDKYKELPSLKKSISNAEKIANKVESNCQETKSYNLKNSKKEDIEHILKSVSQKITSKDTLVFYFSGHGVRYEGQDYLASSHSKPNPLNIKRTWVSTKEVHSYFDAKKIKSGLMIFDAQREQLLKTR